MRLVGFTLEALNDLGFDLLRIAPGGSDLTSKRDIDAAIAIDHLLWQSCNTRGGWACARIDYAAVEQGGRRSFPNRDFNHIAGTDYITRLCRGSEDLRKKALTLACQYPACDGIADLNNLDAHLIGGH